MGWTCCRASVVWSARYSRKSRALGESVGYSGETFDMSTTKPKLLNADDLLRLDGEGVKGELIRGVLCGEMPPGYEHADIVAELTMRLRMFAKSGNLGSVLGELGVRLESDPDTVRAPDVAFVSSGRVPTGAKPKGFSDLVPDLVIEVVSPSDTRRSAHDKALMWNQNGVHLVWVVHPVLRTVDVYVAGGPVTTLTDEDSLDGLEVLSGFTCPVSEIFEG